jgi:hypothetical protein
VENGALTKALCCLLCLAVLQACAPIARGPEQAEPSGIVIEGMVIRNELQFPVTDVMINVSATGAFAGCGNIMQRSECRTSFEQVDYADSAVVVSWKEYGQPHNTGEFVIDIPEEFDTGKPAWLEVVIFAMGQAGARLIQ